MPSATGRVPGNIGRCAAHAIDAHRRSIGLSPDPAGENLSASQLSHFSSVDVVSRVDGLDHDQGVVPVHMHRHDCGCEHVDGHDHVRARQWRSSSIKPLRAAALNVRMRGGGMACTSLVGKCSRAIALSFSSRDNLLKSTLKRARDRL